MWLIFSRPGFFFAHFLWRSFSQKNDVISISSRYDFLMSPIQASERLDQFLTQQWKKNMLSYRNTGKLTCEISWRWSLNGNKQYEKSTKLPNTRLHPRRSSWRQVSHASLQEMDKPQWRVAQACTMWCIQTQ